MTRPALTAREQRVLEVIRSWVAGHGYPPSLREIVYQAELSSTSVARSHLLGLQRKGYLEVVPERARAIRILPAQEAS